MRLSRWMGAPMRGSLGCRVSNQKYKYNELVWYILRYQLSYVAVLKTNHDVIKDKVRFVHFYFVSDECLGEFLSEFFT